MKQERRTTFQKSKTTLSETLTLEGLKITFPYDWEKKLEELRKSKFKSVIFPN